MTIEGIGPHTTNAYWMESGLALVYFFRDGMPMWKNNNARWRTVDTISGVRSSLNGNSANIRAAGSGLLRPQCGRSPFASNSRKAGCGTLFSLDSPPGVQVLALPHPAPDERALAVRHELSGPLVHRLPAEAVRFVATAVHSLESVPPLCRRHAAAVASFLLQLESGPPLRRQQAAVVASFLL